MPEAPAQPRVYAAAVVGLGRIGAAKPAEAPAALGSRMPHSHVAAILACPRLRLAGACDPNPDQAAAFRATWGEAAAGCRLYDTVEELLEREQPEVLTVAVPDHRHTDVVLAATRARVRAILCEKPLATTLRDADALIEACHANDVTLVVNHTRRWHPLHVLARDLVAQGAIGKLDYIVARWGGPRAMLFRNGTHLVDAICFFSGRGPSWVAAWLDDASRDHPPSYQGAGGTDPALDPGVTAVIGLDGGVRAHLEVSKGAIELLEYDLVGSEGRIRLGTDTGELWQRQGADQFGTRPLGTPMTTRADSLAALEELLDLREGRSITPTSSAQEARQAVEILVACLQSNAAGGRRIDWPVMDV